MCDSFMELNQITNKILNRVQLVKSALVPRTMIDFRPFPPNFSFFLGSARTLILTGMVGTLAVNMTIEIGEDWYNYAKSWYGEKRRDWRMKLDSNKNLTKENQELITKTQGYNILEFSSSRPEALSGINSNDEYNTIDLREKIKIFNCQLITLDRTMRNNGQMGKINIPMLTRYMSKLKLEGDIADCRSAFKCRSSQMHSTDILCECTNYTQILELDVVDEMVGLIFHSIVVEFNRKTRRISESNLPIFPPKYLSQWKTIDILLIIKHMVETDYQTLENIRIRLEVIGFLCYIQINKTFKMVYKYLTNLLGDPELQLTFEDISVHSFIDDLAKSSKLVANLDDVDKKEKEEENYKNPKNIQEEMKSKTINILGRFNNSLSHSNLVDKFISELETNYENDFLTMKKDELIGFIEDCSIGYYRQIFVTNTLLPILNNIILEQNKQKEMFTEIYRELKLDYKNKNKKGINMEYDFRLLERKLSDIDLEIEKIVNLVYIVELDDQNRKNRSTVVPLEHIFQMLLFYLMLQPENYFTLTEYIGRILLQP